MKKNVKGALALVCWTAVEPIEQQTSPNVFYVESRNKQTVTSAEMDARQVLASLILSFRVRKIQIGRERLYSVYTFRNYEDVDDVLGIIRETISMASDVQIGGT